MKNTTNDQQTTIPLYDVIIVGAGVSGLSAAYDLHNHNNKNKSLSSSSGRELKVKILEAHPTRVGGRNCCDEDGTDLGSGYIGPTQDRVSCLIDDLGLKLRKVYTTGKTIQMINGKPTPYEGTIPPISVLGLLDINNVLFEIDKIANQIDLDNPHLCPDAAKLDTITVAEHMRNICLSEDAQNMVTTAVRAVCAVEPCEMSLLGFAWYMKNSGNIKRALETKDGAQDSKVEGGTGRIALELAKRLPQDWIRLNAPVREIIDEKDAVILVGRDFEYRAKTVILAIPPIQQFRIEFSPRLSGNHLQALQRFPFGHAIKTFTYYEKAFWREKGFNGSIVCDEGIGQVCIDDTKSDGSNPCIMGFVMSQNAAFWGIEGKTKEDRQKALAKHFAKAFGVKEEDYPVVDYKEKNWAEESFVGGCYVGVPSPTTLTKFAKEVNRRSFINNRQEEEESKKEFHHDDYRQNTARLFIAGTEAAAEFVGYLEGAVEAGQRSARNVLIRLGENKKDKFDEVTKPAPSPQNPFVEMDLTFEEKYLIPSAKKFLWSVGLSSVLIGGIAVYWKVIRNNKQQ